MLNVIGGFDGVAGARCKVQGIDKSHNSLHLALVTLHFVPCTLPRVSYHLGVMNSGVDAGVGHRRIHAQNRYCRINYVRQRGWLQLAPFIVRKGKTFSHQTSPTRTYDLKVERRGYGPPVST